MKMITHSGSAPRLAAFAVLAATAGLSACNQSFDEDAVMAAARDTTVTAKTSVKYVTDAQGNSVDATPLSISFRQSSVGEQGPEPSIGITSNGCMFFPALERVMRSCDYGESWERVDDIFSQPVTFDPYLWVDTATDRVFNIQMGLLTHTWIAWSDDDGASWLANPYDQGPLPVNDHMKLGSGPWTEEGLGIIGSELPLYDQAVYFCFNKLLGVFCYTSLDGGATFPIGGQIVGLATTGGGLHGAITTAPDGTVYLPPRLGTPTLIVSKDNGLSWETVTMGHDVGTPNPRKNSEVGTDSQSNAYHVWTGEDGGVYMARSTDSGSTWDETSLRISPRAVISSTFPHIDAGDPGRIAIAYLGSEDKQFYNTADIDSQPWRGNPHTAPNDTVYHLYVTYSLNALDDEPVFHTVQITEDPVQRGSICISSGDCRDIGSSNNRNLLDFNDLHLDKEGRVYIAFADGCTGSCAESGSAPDSRDALGMVAILESGPSLYAEKGTVKPLD